MSSPPYIVIKKTYFFYGIEKYYIDGPVVRVMEVNVTFNNILVILWWSVLLLGETAVPRENHRPAASHCMTNFIT